MQRALIDIMTPAEAEKYRVMLEGQDWKEGKARTAELTGTVKKNKELKPEESEVIKAISMELMQKVMANTEFARFTQCKAMTAFKFNNYDEPDGAYHLHTDAPFMVTCRTDFTVLLALTDPDAYKGGDHHVLSPLEGEIVYRPQAGQMIIYETGYPHFVDPVNDGARISALSWCESYFPTERQRAICATIRKLSGEFEKRMLEAETEEEKAQYREWFVDTGSAHSGLYRLWANKR